MTDYVALIPGHRERMVRHFIALRQLDANYARIALATYIALDGCPHPDITADVRAAWERFKLEQGAKSDQSEKRG